MISCIIVDDEPRAIDLMESHVLKLPELELRGKFRSSVKAYEYIQKESVDLIFMDINMPQLNGLELAELIKNKSKIIFTTAYSNHAVQGFDLDAIDYLVKPIEFKRFLQAVEKSREVVSSKLASTLDNSNPVVHIEYKGVMYRFDSNDITYIESHKSYCHFNSKSSKEVKIIRIHIGELIDLLPSDRFIRIHKSYLVNIRLIEQIERNQIYVGKKALPIGGTYRQNLINRFRSYQN